MDSAETTTLITRAPPRARSASALRRAVDRLPSVSETTVFQRPPTPPPSITLDFDEVPTLTELDDPDTISERGQTWLVRPVAEHTRILKMPSTYDPAPERQDDARWFMPTILVCALVTALLVAASF